LHGLRYPRVVSLPLPSSQLVRDLVREAEEVMARLQQGEGEAVKARWGSRAGRAVEKRQSDLS
jgi:hypothetical protein